VDAQTERTHDVYITFVASAPLGGYNVSFKAWRSCSLKENAGPADRRSADTEIEETLLFA
jgi:hypothetical protein